MVRGPTYFVDRSLNLVSGPKILSERLRRLNPDQWQSSTIASLGNPNDDLIYPVSPDGKLVFGRLYKPYSPSSKVKFRFYLPKYRLKTYQHDGLSLPDIRMQWMTTQTGAILEGEELARLIVKLEPIRQSQSGVPKRILDHEIALSLRYFSVDQQGKPRHRVTLPFDRILTDQNGAVVASMTIMDMETLAQIVTAMSKRACRAVFAVKATALMYVPVAQYVIDLATFHNARFHESLWEADLIADSVVSSQRLRKSGKKPLAKIKRPVKLHRATTGSGGFVPSLGGPGAFPVTLPRPRFLLSRGTGPERDTVTLRPIVVGGTLPIVAHPVVHAPWIGTAILHPAITASLLRPVPLARWHKVSVPNPLAVSTFMKDVAIADLGHDQKTIKQEFKTSPHRVGTKRALIPVSLETRTGKKIDVKKELDATQVLRAFYSIQNFGQIYADIPDHIMDRIRGFKDPTVLIAHNVTVPPRTLVVYQDPIQENLFYYLPEKFKLGRADNPPYEPLLRIGFKELLLEEESSDQVDLTYRVEVTFTASPYIDRDFYAAVRSNSVLQSAAGGKQIVLVPLDAGDARLELNDITNVLNGEVLDHTISPSSGVMVTFELGSADFDKFFASLMNDAGVPAIRGKIKIPTLPASQSDIDLSISLYDTVGPVFSQQWGQASGDPQGTYRVLLKNETESTVGVGSSRAWVTAEGTLATGIIPSEEGRFSTGSGMTHEMKVRINPPDAEVRDIEIETHHSFSLDVEALWALITLIQGLSSYAYEIDVVMEEPELFGTSPGGDIPPLTALKVEFQEGAEVLLTPEQPGVKAILYKSILADLQNQPLTETHTYRVTNIHGNQEWARGNWTTSQGTLHVSPVRPGS